MPRGHGLQAGPCCVVVLGAQVAAQGSAMVCKLFVCLFVCYMAVANRAAERQTVTNHILVTVVIISNAR